MVSKHLANYKKGVNLTHCHIKLQSRAESKIVGGGGGTIPPVGVQTYNFAKFSEKKKPHEFEKIFGPWGRGGWGCVGGAPLRQRSH